MTFNLANAIMLAGIIQGFVFAIVVFVSHKYRATVTRILAGLILIFSLDNLQYYLEDIGLITEKQLLGIYFIPFEMLSAPLLLLYGLFLLNPNRKFAAKDALLLLPFVIALLIVSIVKCTYYKSDSSVAALAIFQGFEEILEYGAIAFDLTVLLVLLAKTHRFKQIHSQRLKCYPQIKWLRIMLIVLLLLSVLWIFVTIADYYFGTAYWYLLYIGMSGAIYWLGHVGLFQFDIEQQQNIVRNYSIKPLQSALNPDNKSEHIKDFEHLIETQKRFLDRQISLDTIAEELQISKSHLSRLINTEMHRSFPDYLNRLRVAQAQIYLAHPEFQHYTLVAIGMESGFNSKTAFHTSFKKVTGMTPAEFRKQNTTASKLPI